MTSRRARAPRGQRAVGIAPRNHGTNVTLLAALVPTGMNCGVSIVPCGVVSVPSRARPIPVSRVLNSMGPGIGTKRSGLGGDEMGVEGLGYRL